MDEQNKREENETSQNSPVETGGEKNQEAGQKSSSDQQKVFGIIGYIFPILFFLPLVSEETKNNSFAKFHANQQLNLLLYYVVGYVASILLTVIIIGVFLIPLVTLGGIIFLILGVINVLNNEMKPLPFIGGFKLLK